MKMVAVCACPSGIAHTYMAAERLELAAKKLGISAKVETQGAMGIENRLSAKDVAEADFVVVTNDVKIQEIDRFSGKPVFDLSSHDAIKKAQPFLQSAVEQLGKA